MSLSLAHPIPRPFTLYLCSYQPGRILLSQAAKDIADTMAKSRNVVYLPNSGNMLLGVNNA